MLEYQIRLINLRKFVISSNWNLLHTIIVYIVAYWQIFHAHLWIKMLFIANPPPSTNCIDIIVFWLKYSRNWILNELKLLTASVMKELSSHLEILAALFTEKFEIHYIKNGIIIKFWSTVIVTIP